MKRFSYLLGLLVPVLVLFFGCSEDVLENEEKERRYVVDALSLQEAKVAFENLEREKLQERQYQKDGYFLELTPDWQSFRQEEIVENYSYSHLKTQVFGSDLEGELLFFRLKDSLVSYLMIQNVDEFDPNREIFQYFDLKGKFVDGYVLENGDFTYRMVSRESSSLFEKKHGDCKRLQREARRRNLPKESCYDLEPVYLDAPKKIAENCKNLSAKSGKCKYDPLDIYWARKMNCEDPDDESCFRLNDYISQLIKQSAIHGRGRGGTKPKPKPDENVEDELTDKCAKEILSQMQGSTGFKNFLNEANLHGGRHNFSEMIIDLFQKSSQTHLVFQNGTTKNGANGSTSGTTITLNNNYLQTATQLAIARTIIHEMVHAYLTSNYHGYPEVSDGNFQDALRKYFATNYKGMDMKRAQHEFMGQYIEAMAISLQQWDMRYGTGTDLGFEYYKALSYGGLFQTDVNGAITTETNSFKQLVPNAKDRQDIANKILNEQNNNGNAKGSKCR